MELEGAFLMKISANDLVICPAQGIYISTAPDSITPVLCPPGDKVYFISVLILNSKYLIEFLILIFFYKCCPNLIPKRDFL